jgi:hypothetical protein
MISKANAKIMNQKLIFWLLLIYALALCAIAEPARGESVNNSSVDGGTPQIVKVVDIGFRPETNGFRFVNYGDDIPTTGLTPIEMKRLFGDRVVAGLNDGKPILKFPATRWMNEANAAMAAGHCEGMAVLSALMYYNKVSPSAFGYKAAADLSLQNELLQREIAYWWTTQVTHPGGAIRVIESPNMVFDTLANAFKKGLGSDEWWVMGIYMPNGSGGHSITPFAVDNMSNGTASILVYDNNLPWETRAVKIDRIADTWEYSGSINPNEPSQLYSGNASTQNLEVVSLSSRLVTQDCDFCADENNTTLGRAKGSLLKGRQAQIWVSGKGDFFITDDKGRRIGITESGEFVNEIPNAERTKLKFVGPANINVYELKLMGDSTLYFGEGTSGVWSFFQGLAIGIDNLGKSGTVDLSVSEDGDVKVLSNLDSATITFSGDTETQLGPLPAGSVIEYDAGTNTLTATLDPPGEITLKTSSFDGSELMQSSKELTDVKSLFFDGSKIKVIHSDGSEETFQLTFSKVEDQNVDVVYRTLSLEIPCGCSP